MITITIAGMTITMVTAITITIITTRMAPIQPFGIAAGLSSPQPSSWRLWRLPVLSSSAQVKQSL
jgi:hypothetical protein